MNRLRPKKIVNISEDSPVILYKKLCPDMKSPYQQFQYIIGKTYFVKKFNEDIHKGCTKDRLYSIPKNEFIKWAGIRYFKVHVWGKCILEKDDKVGSEYLKIVEELKPKEFVKYMSSGQAYHYCFLIKDIKIVRDEINQSYYAFLYCKYIKDRKEVREKINDSYYAYMYCKQIKDRKGVRDKIIISYWAYLYCIDIRNRKEIRDRIINLKFIQWLRNKKNVKNKKDKQ